MLDCTLSWVVGCKAVGPLDTLSFAASNILLGSLLPSHSHTPHLPQQHRCHREQLEALKSTESIFINFFSNCYFCSLAFTFKASFNTPGLCQKDLFDRFQTTGAKLPVIGLVAGSGTSEHDVVAVVTARNAGLVIFRIVLKET